MQMNPRWRARFGTALMHLLAIPVIAAIALAAPPAFSQEKAADVTDMQALRDAVKSDRKAFVASTLKLTPAEEKRFWPIYDAYQRVVDQTSRRTVLAVEAELFRDKPMSSLAAKSLATELLKADEAEIKARHTMQTRVMRALPPMKAARYLQLEDKIRAMRDYDIAATVPLIR